MWLPSCALTGKAYSKLTGTFGVYSRGSTGNSRVVFSSTANRCISSRSVREMTSRSVLSKSLSTPSSRRSLPLLPPALPVRPMMQSRWLTWIDRGYCLGWISDRAVLYVPYVAYRTVQDISLT
jgi:hypothetical protein